MFQSIPVLAGSGPGPFGIDTNKRDALSGIAHDLNNILQIIAGNLTILSRSIGEDNVAKVHVARAMAGVDLGTRLACRALGRGEIGEARLEAVELRTAMKAMTCLLLDAAGPTVSVSFDLQSTAPLEVDMPELQNVLLNLTLNAKHAMDGVGTVTISALDGRGGEPVRISVADTGCGMSSDVCERMFDSGFTTKGAKGSGIGCSTVRRFAERHGGSVSVDSALGRGTTVTISLPTKAQFPTGARSTDRSAFEA